MGKGLINKIMLKSLLEDADCGEILTALIDEGIISKSDVAEYYNGEIAPFLRGAKYSERYVCSDGYHDGLEKFDTRDLTESGEAIIWDGIVEIYDEAFANCSQVTKVVVPKNVKKIRRLAFNNCPNLETVVLPKDLKEIEYGAFANCPKLTNINIPKLNVKMGKDVFLNTPAGEKFMQQLEERRLELNKWSGIDKPMYSYIIDRNLVQFDERDLDKNGEFIVPAQVVKIGERAFESCRKLTKIKFLPGIREIGSWAFAFSYLQEVEMADTITKIGREAFKGSSDLKEIILPKGLRRIEYYTFAGCGLEKVVLPEELTSIDDMAFYNCKYLKDINVPDSLSYINLRAFYGTGVDYKKLIKEKAKEKGKYVDERDYDWYVM